MNVNTDFDKMDLAVTRTRERAVVKICLTWISSEEIGNCLGIHPSSACCLEMNISPVKEFFCTIVSAKWCVLMLITVLMLI